MRCCCFAHCAGPKLDSCPVLSYSHARECELHFFSPKILCVVQFYTTHMEIKKIQILFYKSGAEQTQLYNINIVKLPLKQTTLYRSVGKCFKCSRKGQGRMGSTLSTAFFFLWTFFNVYYISQFTNIDFFYKQYISCLIGPITIMSRSKWTERPNKIISQPSLSRVIRGD